jgi:hypothetical protein
MKVSFYWAALSGLLITSCTDTPPEKSDVVLPLTRPWEKALPHQEIPEGLTSLSAASCGSCHTEHYAEWKLSTHAHAWTDLQFQAELRKESSPFLCINCHIPLQNQQEYVVEGLVNGDIYRPVKHKNPHFDASLQQEGINCASCHVRDGAVLGPTGAPNAPHKTIKGNALLSEELCISCHNASAVVTPTLVCAFETGDEWRNGPYYGVKNCISCHMEAVERERVQGFGLRPSRRHLFSGSGIPKHDTLKTTMLNGLEIAGDKQPIFLRIYDTLKYQLKVVNAHAGHRVPSGDPERFIRFEFVLSDRRDSTIAVQTHRIGEEWEWHPQARKLTDNNMYPGEERQYLFKKAGLASGEYRLNVRATKHRMNEEAAVYNKLGTAYPRYIEIENYDVKVVIK